MLRENKPNHAKYLEGLVLRRCSSRNRKLKILHLLFAGLCDGSDFSALHDYEIMNRVLFYIPHTRWKYRRFITETQGYDYYGSLKIKEGRKKSNVL